MIALIAKSKLMKRKRAFIALLILFVVAILLHLCYLKEERVQPGRLLPINQTTIEGYH
jgi:hypothetical protein